MAALTGERDTPKRHRNYVESYPCKGNAKAYSGGLAAADANGYLVKAADLANYKVLGRLQASFDTTATGPDGVLADGAIEREVESGIHLYKTTSDANAITVADIGKFAYVVDDQTVARAAGTANSVKAGKVIGLRDGQVVLDTSAVPAV